MNSHLSSALVLDAQLDAAKEKIRKLEAKVAKLEGKIEQKDGIIEVQDRRIRNYELEIARLQCQIKAMAERSDMSRNRNDADLVNGNQP
jgi:peptidoglycan hydrolase CwlO-like protein